MRTDSRALLERMIQRIPSQQRRGRRWDAFSHRLEKHFGRLFSLLLELYGSNYDFLYFVEDLLFGMWNCCRERSAGLAEIDEIHEQDPSWFTRQDIVGAIVYADLFAGDLKGVQQQLPCLEELGITYLHLMPLFKAPEGESDGGYAVSSYREVQQHLGTMDDLRELAAMLRKRGITLVLDFILNHTSDQHEWARRAAEGDAYYQNFYYLFPDRREPDEYNAHLREIFPEARTGSFSYREDIGKWVWTTFNSFQWDLNYQNHEVFKAMAEEMLFLANVGVGVLRFDAIAFVWKEKGTVCESLPKAHTVIKAFKALAAVAAPSLVFKSEAIVHPDEVSQYIGTNECALSYNPLIMATAWEGLATRDPRLFRSSIIHRYYIPPGCSWVNYVRSHDDIGWTFDDGDAAMIGINGFFHRRFLNEFYTGRFPGSFARGLPFQENPKTGDCRISGTCASLTGLEKGIVMNDDQEISLAVAKIVMLYGLMFTLGGIPLIYIGDEIGLLNDYSYAADPSKARDSRWVHRVPMDWHKAELRHREGTVEHRIFSRIQRMIQVRKQESALAMGSLKVVDHGHPHLLAFVREAEDHRVIVMANFSDRPTWISQNDLLLMECPEGSVDILADAGLHDSLELAPWGMKWVKPPAS